MMFQQIFSRARKVFDVSNNKKLFFYAGSILVFFCSISLHPILSRFAITFTENYVLHRGINVSVWTERLNFLSCIGMLAGILCLCFFSIKFVVVLLPAFGFVLTTLFGLNTIVLDDWATIIWFLDDVSKNGLSFSNLFAQNNDSRYLFPKLVWLLLGEPFHVNMKVYMYFEWLLITLSYFLAIFYVSRQNKSKQSDKQRLLVYLLLGFISFTVLQWELDALLEATSVNWFLKHLFLILGFLCFHYGYNCAYDASRKIKYLLCAGLSFVIASFSHLSGTFWLPVILVIFFLLLISKEKVQKKMVIFTFVLCILIYPLYFYTWHKMDIHADYHYAQFKDIIGYFFAVLGSPLIPRHFSQNGTLLRSLLMGISLFIIAMVLVAYLIKHRKITANIFPLCLIFYGFAFCASTTMGRVGFGIGQALSNRYVVNILPAIIGIVLIVYKEVITAESCGQTVKTISKYGLLALFFLCFSINTDWSIPRNAYNQRKEMQKILSDYRNQPLSALQTFFPWWNNLETAIATIEIAETNGWSVFYKNKARPPLEFTQVASVPFTADVSVRNDIAETRVVDGNLILHSGKYDPFIIFPLKEALDFQHGETWIELKYTNTASGTIQVFYDYGSSFSEQNSSRMFVNTSDKTQTIHFPIKGWQKENRPLQIRIDPPDGSEFRIESINIVSADS